MNMQFNQTKNFKQKIILLVLVVLLLLTFYYFASSVKKSYRSGNLQAEYQIRKGHPIHLPTYLNPSSVNNWMTFDYLNVVFKLPSDYLKNNLQINDPRYPNISLNHYIRENNFNSSIFLRSIQNLIINYSAPK